MPFLPVHTTETPTPRWIGLDLAKRETQLVALNHEGAVIHSYRFATTRENVLALAAELVPSDTVVLEVTTNSYQIARLLRAHSSAILILSNPILTLKIAKSKIKTDKIDARVLAELARVDYLPTVWMPDEDTEALRHLFTDRRSLVSRRTELKNTVHSILHRNLITCSHEDLFGTGGRSWLDALCQSSDVECDKLDRLRMQAILLELDRLEESLLEVEGVIAAFIAERPKLRADLDRLLSIPGVSLVVGAGLLAAIGEVSRFSSPKRLASYFGLVPSTYQSGDTKHHGRITKQGRSEARWLAVEASEHLRKAPGPMRALYTRVAHKRGHNVAVVAVARKLAELVFHLLTKQQEFIYQQPRLTKEKRSRVRLMARRKTGRKVATATPRVVPRAALYGTGLAGKKLAPKLARLAAEQAEEIYQAIVADRCTHPTKPLGATEETPPIFDPTRPTLESWERVLKVVARELFKTKEKEE